MSPVPRANCATMSDFLISATDICFSFETNKRSRKNGRAVVSCNYEVFTAASTALLLRYSLAEIFDKARIVAQRPCAANPPVTTRSRTLHLADRRGRGTLRRQRQHGAKTIAGALVVEAHARRTLLVHLHDVKGLDRLMIVGAHQDRMEAVVETQPFECLRDRRRFGRGRLRHRLGEHLDHHRHAQHRVVVLRRRIARAECLVPRVGGRAARVRVPVGHGDHVLDARVAERGRGAEAVAVKGVELRVEALLARRLHQQREVVAPVTRDDRVGARRADLRDIRREILHAADRVKLVADDRDIGPVLRQRRARERAHVVAEAVVLIEQVDLPDRFVGGDHVRERVHAHARVRVEAEVPEAAIRVGERGIVGGIVEEQLAVIGLARVLTVDGRHQRRRHRRAVALHDEADVAVLRRAQLHQRGFGAALAVEHDQFERMPPVGQRHTALRVYALDAQTQVALDRRARIGERAGHAFDQRERDRLACRHAARLGGVHRTQRARGRHAQERRRQRQQRRGVGEISRESCRHALCPLATQTRIKRGS
ncbi:hypothetical protein PT2222_90051 [Paraburkholderia tropica]